MSYQDQDQAGLGEGPRDDRAATRTVWETLEREGRFRRFLDASRQAGLEGVLRGPDLITAFAVPDSVATGPDLGATVARHIVRGYQTSADLRIAGTVRSLEGDAVPVALRDGYGIFAGIKVTRSDVACTNGMIHELERATLESAA